MRRVERVGIDDLPMLRVCSVPGCGLIIEGHCPVHPGATRKAVTTRAWRRRREARLRKAKGRCELCGGPAKVVHHVERVVITGNEIVELDGLMACCAACAAELDRLGKVSN